MILSGIHDDEYWKKTLEKNPDSLLAKAFVHAEQLTKKEMIQVVGWTAYEICGRWFKANQHLKPV